ncbi:glucuronate isomerase [Cohnella nanjingensis]|uniref:Uronate isomerase n=1 Tax=Cohnella nanjingensis TaxID=1387779 RepID=A0A7X0RN26_9BACL|nr:glucuronate isomerase [Cohnella nanjingensis]MBB6670557.1 glucuronate isomerase [Cohnella nanjingensis]
MRSFLDDNFLLGNETAVRLYRDYAKTLPIIDYHCHLSPQEIYENRAFENLTQAWLYGDHYKWRAMRANGIEERYVTGGEGVSDYDRFLAWAQTVPRTIGNPLYHWSHLELRRYFGVEDIVSERTAPAIWAQANAKLAAGGLSARDLIVKSNVKVVCTTDDPADSLAYHRLIRELPDFDVKVLPSFRPDKALEIGRATFLPWIRGLEGVAGAALPDYEALLRALGDRIDFFHAAGCRVSDHALDVVGYAEATKEEAAAVYRKALAGESFTAEEERKYKSYTLRFLSRRYAELGWAMQLHMHASRNNNARMFRRLGPDTGYDSMYDGPVSDAIVRLLDALDREDALPKTIVYSLNPNDLYVLGTAIGSFQGGGVPGKMQLGSAWWFNDTKDGMLEQLKALANTGLLSRFVGMLTDSRSFLSYTRHEYFRRILCNLLGEWAENGEVPADPELLGGIVQDIGYNNAQAYFNFE